VNIPPDLKLIQQAASVEAANTLLAAGWTLITIASGSTKESGLVYVFGWAHSDLPPEPETPVRLSGNLASNARQ
jgi:hypothetical protein